MTPQPLTVLFAMALEPGHYAGTFRLAKELRARGHRVLYLGIPDFQALVEKNGFQLVPFAADLLPAGYGDRFAASQAGKRRADERLFSDYLRRIEDGELDGCLKASGADIVLCDNLMWYVALRALRMNIRVVNVSIILSQYANDVVPPFTSMMRPGPGVRAEWSRQRFRFLFTKLLASKLRGAYRAPTRMHHLTDVFQGIARRSGYPLRENETWWFTEVGPRLALPEIVLCPRAFQFPKAPEDGRVYMGAFVDTERPEEPLEPAALDEGKPLVYCSLGTAAPFYPHSMRFFQAVVDAARLRPDRHWVLHCANHPGAETLEPLPGNVLMRRRVPQLALLQRASAMVTHGGINSVMECIHFGVPMVIVPGLRDQPGNAVRAEHHGIAVTLEMARITGELLVASVDEALASEPLCKALKKMRAAIDSERGLDAALRLIETGSPVARITAARAASEVASDRLEMADRPG